MKLLSDGVTCLRSFAWFINAAHNDLISCFDTTDDTSRIDQLSVDKETACSIDVITVVPPPTTTTAIVVVG